MIVLSLAVAASIVAQLDRVDTEIDARIGDDLAKVAIRVKSRYTPGEPLSRITIILAAERLRAPSPKMRPSEEREVFRGPSDFGGFDGVHIQIGGSPCDPAHQTLDDGAVVLSCKYALHAGEAVDVAMEASLSVPEKYGELGRRGRQVTLGAGWYPYVARVGAAPPLGPHRITLDLPASHGAVLGRTYFPPSGDPTLSTRRLEVTRRAAMNVPLIVLPPGTGRARIREGRAIYVSASGATVHDPKIRLEKDEQIVEALEDGLLYWEEQGLPTPEANAPLVVVEAPLRHVLALAGDGVVLVSDRAFRMLPFARLYRFHRFPLLREVFAELFLERMRSKPLLGPERSAWVTADALAAHLVDRYVRDRFERRENAFDVLSWFSFIPAVDALLYAPDLPFESAYFRRTKEDDPLRPNLVDYPSLAPRGKIIYEKLLDRIQRAGADRVFARVRAGVSLEAAIAPELGAETDAFLSAWLRPYPKVQYALVGYSSEPARGCSTLPCFLGKVEIRRIGDAVKEPIEVLMEDESGHERHVWSAASDAEDRTVTATLAAPLRFVEIDPNDRIYETPTDEIPSPRYDNRSSSSWKFLLNNFNVALAATAGTIDTALDVGLLRVYDVHWAYAVRASYDPAAIALQLRTSYGFGDRVTPAYLAQRIGLSASGEYLRPSFGGTTQSALGLSAALYYALDTRQTVWAPEGGQGLRATLEYNHTFGQIVEHDLGGVVRPLSEDSMAFTVRAFEAWRLGAAHTLAIRGMAGSYVFGEPRAQLLYALGGRTNVRGYAIDARLGKAEGIASTEWIHTLIPELNDNAFYFSWVSGLDGTLYADLAVVADDIRAISSAPPSADVGYGFRIFIDYFGVRPGIMAVDIAFPLFDVRGKGGFGPPAVYIDFTQSF